MTSGCGCRALRSRSVAPHRLRRTGHEQVLPGAASAAAADAGGRPTQTVRAAQPFRRAGRAERWRDRRTAGRARCGYAAPVWRYAAKSANARAAGTDSATAQVTDQPLERAGAACRKLVRAARLARTRQRFATCNHDVPPVVDAKGACATARPKVAAILAREIFIGAGCAERRELRRTDILSVLDHTVVVRAALRDVARWIDRRARRTGLLGFAHFGPVVWCMSLCNGDEVEGRGLTRHAAIWLTQHAIAVPAASGKLRLSDVQRRAAPAAAERHKVRLIGCGALRTDRMRIGAGVGVKLRLSSFMNAGHVRERRFAARRAAARGERQTLSRPVARRPAGHAAAATLPCAAAAATWRAGNGGSAAADRNQAGRAERRHHSQPPSCMLEEVHRTLLDASRMPPVCENSRARIDWGSARHEKRATAKERREARRVLAPCSRASSALDSLATVCEGSRTRFFALHIFRP